MFCGWKDCFHIKTFTWRKARAPENFNHYFGIASLPIFLTLVLGVCVRFKLKTIYISKR
jgi:hypothetical protein